MSYVTHGTLNADKSNAVLVVTAIGGNHHRIDHLIGPGKGIEPAKYFVISVDAISNGLTTSSSNSKAQPGMQFFEIQHPRHGELHPVAGEGQVRNREACDRSWGFNESNAGAAIMRRATRR